MHHSTKFLIVIGAMQKESAGASGIAVKQCGK
jgi:hypothetical protein